MGWVKRIFWVFIWIAGCGKVLAVPVVGGEICYTHLGNGKYEVIVIAYRDCGGSSMSYTPIVTSAGGTQIHSGGTGPYLIEDVTPICKRGCTKCSSSTCTFPFGLEKHIIRDTVDLSQYSDCEFTFSWAPGFRSSAITTGPASTRFYLESTLNRCLTGDHSSARFENNPRFILEKAFCTQYYENGYAEEGDSLIYEQVNPMTPPLYSAAKYNSGYSKDEPIRYSGYPNKTWKPASCEGFRFDKFTGRLDFKPVYGNEVSVFAFKIHHYRKDTSNAWQEIGTVVREYNVTVTTSYGNRYPAVSNLVGTPEKIILCRDDVYDKIIAGFDPDIQDTVRMTSDKVLPGAVIAMNGKLPYLKWTPDSTLVRDQPYDAILTLKDDACPMPGIAQQRYLFYIKGPFPKYTYTISDSACDTRHFEVKHDTTVHLDYRWWLDNKLVDSSSKWVHRFDTNGNYVVRLQLTAPSGCVRNEYRTIGITDVPYFTAGNDTTICKGSSIQLHAKGGVSYIWDDAYNTLSSKTVADPIATTGSSRLYKVIITDSNGCTHKDYVNVVVRDFLIVPSATKYQIYCKNGGDSIILRPYFAKKFQWWTKRGFVDTTHIELHVAPREKTTYYITQQNTDGCVKTDSFIVDVDTVEAVISPTTEICYGDSIRLLASGGKVAWYPASGITELNSSTPFVKPTESQYYKVKISHGTCYATDSVLVIVNKVIPVVTRPSAVLCPGDTIQLKATGGIDYSWQPSSYMIGVNTNNPRVFPPNTTKYTVTIKNPVTGCSAKDTITVFVKKGCVWPGDANYDGVANYEDLLDFGIGFGSNGLKRAIVSTTWQGFESDDWTKKTGAGVNYKYMDFNGDGYINLSDTAVFRINYGKTSANRITRTYWPTYAALSFRFEKDPLYAGDTVNAGLYLDDVHHGFCGVGFKYLYVDYLAVPGSLKFSFEKRPAYFDLSLSRSQAAGTGEAAIVGTNHRNSFGTVKIASIQFILKDSTYFDPSGWIMLDLPRAVLIDSAGDVYTPKLNNAKALVLKKRSSGIQDIENPAEWVSVYPNPASGFVIIEARETRIKSVVIKDMVGKVVSMNSSATGNAITLKAESLAPGLYILEITTSKGIVKRKLVIDR
jgi:hypothetical protein